MDGWGRQVEGAAVMTWGVGATWKDGWRRQQRRHQEKEGGRNCTGSTTRDNARHEDGRQTGTVMGGHEHRMGGRGHGRAWTMTGTSSRGRAALGMATGEGVEGAIGREEWREGGKTSRREIGKRRWKEMILKRKRTNRGKNDNLYNLMPCIQGRRREALFFMVNTWIM